MPLWKQNKYTKWYFKLMDNAKHREKEVGKYYEEHHIFPTSLGGPDHKENLVNLTAREHFLAHLMLVRMAYDANSKHKMVHSAWYFQGNFKHHQMKINSRTFEILREQKIEAIKARKHTPEEIEKRRLANIGKKRTEEQKQRMSEAQRKRVDSDPNYIAKCSQRFKDWHAALTDEERAQMKANQSQAALNRTPHTEETKKKISEAFKGKPLSDEHKKKISEAHQKRNGPKEIKYKEVIQWIVEREDGTQINILNLNVWAQENSLKPRSLYGTENKNKWHNGFRIAKREIILVPREKQ